MTPADTLRWHVIRLGLLSFTLTGDAGGEVAAASVNEAIACLNVAIRALDPVVTKP